MEDKKQEMKDINSDKTLKVEDLFAGYDDFVSGKKDTYVEPVNEDLFEEKETKQTTESGLSGIDSLIDEMMGVSDLSKSTEEQDESAREDDEKIVEPGKCEINANKEDKKGKITEDERIFSHNSDTESVEKKGKKKRNKKQQLSAEELRKKAEIRESYLKDHKKFYVGIGAAVLTLWVATGVLGYTSACLVDEIDDYNLETKLYEAQKENQELENDNYYLTCERDQALRDLEHLTGLKEEYEKGIDESKELEQKLNFYKSAYQQIEQELKELKNEINKLAGENFELQEKFNDLLLIKQELEAELKLYQDADSLGTTESSTNIGEEMGLE